MRRKAGNFRKLAAVILAGSCVMAWAMGSAAETVDLSEA